MLHELHLNLHSAALSFFLISIILSNLDAKDIFILVITGYTSVHRPTRSSERRRGDEDDDDVSAERGRMCGNKALKQQLMTAISEAV